MAEAKKVVLVQNLAAEAVGALHRLFAHLEAGDDRADCDKVMQGFDVVAAITALGKLAEGREVEDYENPLLYPNRRHHVNIGPPNFCRHQSFNIRSLLVKEERGAGDQIPYIKNIRVSRIARYEEDELYELCVMQQLSREDTAAVVAVAVATYRVGDDSVDIEHLVPVLRKSCSPPRVVLFPSAMHIPDDTIYVGGLPSIDPFWDLLKDKEEPAAKRLRASDIKDEDE